MVSRKPSIAIKDGTSRKPRAVQLEALQWLDDNWDEAKFKVLQKPVGAGKSWLAKAIQNATGGAIITPSNLLIRQYQDTYKSTNDLMGRKHYTCTLYSGASCEDVKDTGLHINTTTGTMGGYCDNCVYSCKRDKALAGEPTFFNPMSFIYLNMQKGGEDSKAEYHETIIVDEAHQLVSMLLMMTGHKFWASQTALPNAVTNELQIIKWFDEVTPKLRQQQRVYTLALAKVEKKSDKADLTKRLTEIDETIVAISNIRYGLKTEPQNFAWERGETTRYRQKDQFFSIRPIRVPNYTLKLLFGRARHVVLMSGTMLKTDIEELTAGSSHVFADFKSPIPADRRLIHHEPTPYQINRDTNPQQLAKDILKKCKENPGNTIIHVTYEWSRKLQPFMPPGVLFNTAESKDKTLETFKKNGGIWLASGCAEGIDLPDDLCRTNIVAVLAYPNLGDPIVQKRKALVDGDLWYKLETLKSVIQAAGRSTRHETDYSKTIIMPPAFKWVARSVWSHLPTSFTDAIRWSSK